MQTINCVRVAQEEVRNHRVAGLSYEAAVEKALEHVVIDEDHPAFDSLNIGCLAVVDQVMYGLNLSHLIG